MFFTKLSVSIVRNTAFLSLEQNKKKIKLKRPRTVNSIVTRLGQPKETVIFSGKESYILNTRKYFGADPGGRQSKAWVCVRSLAGFRVRIPSGTWLSLGSVVCCQVAVSETGRSLVQRVPTARVYVIVCDHIQ